MECLSITNMAVLAMFHLHKTLQLTLWIVVAGTPRRLRERRQEDTASPSTTQCRCCCGTRQDRQRIRGV